MNSVGMTIAGTINQLSVPLFGAPLTVMATSILGAVLGASYGRPIKSRRELLFTVAGHTFLAITIVAVIPAALGWEWVTRKLEAPLAGLLAFVAKFAIPAVPWTELIRKVARLENERGRGYEEYSE